MKYVLGIIASLGLLTTLPSSMGEPDGAKLMKQTCLSCHNFNDAPRTKTGPNLFGVAGSKAGKQDNFTRYSKGMKKIAETDLVWTDENLTAYISDPTGFLREKSADPKARSAMAFRKLSDAEVSAIVEHLKTLK